MRAIENSGRVVERIVCRILGCAQVLTIAASLTGCGNDSQNTSSEGTAPGSAESSSALLFHGKYHGTLVETPVKLTLDRQGDQVNGRLTVGLDSSALTATVTGATAKGRVEDPDGTGGDMEMTIANDTLSMKLTVIDAASGASTVVPITFSTVRETTSSGTAESDVVRDPALVGRWRHTAAGGSGGFSYAIDTWLTIGDDGSFRHGDSKMGAGDASFSSVNESDDAQTGQWKTEDKIIYVKFDGSTEWSPYARYYAEPGRMMLTYDNGNKQVWERQ